MSKDDLRKIEPPLLNAFLELMALESGQPHKGIDFSSWLLLVDTLNSGYGFNSKEELLFICKKLWLKPFHRSSTVVNEDVLTNIIEKNLEVYAGIVEDNSKGKREDEKKRTDPPKPKIDSRNEKQNLPEKHPEPNQPWVEKDDTVTGTLSLLLTDYSSDDTPKAGDEDQHRDLFNSKTYVLEKKYLPVSERFIEQTIRSLRFRSKGIGIPVIDIAATVEQVAKQGYVEDWEKGEEDGFVTRWTLMIDTGGSMSPFQDLCNAIVHSVNNSSMKNEGDVYYFTNVASRNIYLNADQTRIMPMRQLSEGSPRNILIISDAGAARGEFRQQRVDRTYEMLYRLRRHRVAWLNPIPMSRWKNTSAAKIASYVKMFEPGNDNSDTLGNIVQVLKAKKFA